MLSIPTGVVGAFLGIKAIGLDNNIYVQVGLIMLIGLLAKMRSLLWSSPCKDEKQDFPFWIQHWKEQKRGCDRSL
jgi:multidrug efflux pump subunit AcrB